MSRVRFQKSTTSKDWKYLEEKFPGAREVFRDIALILKLTGHENAWLEKGNNSKRGGKRYTLTKGYGEEMLRIYLYTDKDSKMKFYNESNESIVVSTTEDLEIVLRNWAVNL